MPSNPKSKVVRRDIPLVPEDFERSSVLKWWDSVTRNPAFFQVMDRARRECSRSPIPGADSQTTIANYAHCEGFREALDALLKLEPVNPEEGDEFS